MERMEPQMQAPPPPPPPMAAAPMGRPTGATVIAIIAAIQGVLLILVGLFVLLVGGALGGLIGGLAEGEGVPGLGPVFAGLGIFFGIIIGAVGVLYILITYGVWGAKRWSWMLGVVVYIIALAFGVLGLAGGIDVGNLVIGVVLPVVVLYFFWQPDVKRYLGRA
jgi:hypothetical protein